MKKILLLLFFAAPLLFSAKSFAQAPNAAFSCTSCGTFPVATCGPTNYVFQNTSTGVYDSAIWVESVSSIANGCAGPWTTAIVLSYGSHQGNTNHVFGLQTYQPGYYQLCLTVINSTTHQEVTICQCVVIQHPTPTANFTATPNIGCDNVTAVFIPSNQQTTPPYKFIWSLGGSKPGNDTVVCNGMPSLSCGSDSSTYSCDPSNPYHGIFLVVVDGNGCSSIDSFRSAQKAVTVYCSPTASIAVSAGNTCVAPQTIGLTASPAGGTYTWWIPPTSSTATMGPSTTNPQSHSFPTVGCYDVKLAVYLQMQTNPTFGCSDTTILPNAVCLQGICTSPAPTLTISPDTVCAGSPFQVSFTSCGTIPASAGCCINATIVAVPVAGSPACATTVPLGTLSSCGGATATSYFSIPFTSPTSCLVGVVYNIEILGDSIFNTCSGCGIGGINLAKQLTVNPPPAAQISLCPSYISSYCAFSHAFCFKTPTALPNLPGVTYAWYNTPTYAGTPLSTTATCSTTFSGYGGHIIYLKVCQSVANGGCCEYDTMNVVLTQPYGDVTYDAPIGCGFVCDTFKCTTTNDSLYKWFIWDSAGLTITTIAGHTGATLYHCFHGFQNKDTCYTVWLIHITKSVGGVSCFDTIKKPSVITIGHKIHPKFTISTNNICLKRRNVQSPPEACLYVYPDSSLHIGPKPGYPLSHCSNIACNWYFTKVGKLPVYVNASKCDTDKICFTDTGRYVGHFIVNDNECIDTFTLHDTICVRGIVANLIDSLHCASGFFSPVVTYKPSIKYYNCGSTFPANDSFKIHIWQPNSFPSVDLMDTMVAFNRIPSRFNYTYPGGTFYVCMSAYDKFHLLCETDTVCSNVIVYPVTAVINATQVGGGSSTIACRDGVHNQWYFSASGSNPSNPYEPVIQWNFGDSAGYTYGLNTSHLFDSCGTFQVSLHYANTSGSCFDNAHITVQVHDIQDSTGGHNPNGLISASAPPSGCSKCVTFKLKAIFCNTIISHTYIYFGDGTHTTLWGNWAPITHCYTHQPYNAYFVITDTFGCQTNGGNQTYFSPFPYLTAVGANYTGLPSSSGITDTVLCLGTVINFHSVSTGLVSYTNWAITNLSDGCNGTPTLAQGTNLNLSSNTIFNTPGYYYLYLKVWNNYSDSAGHNCMSDTCTLIHIENPVACFQSPDTFNCPGSFGTLINCSTGAFDSLVVQISLPAPSTTIFTYSYSRFSPAGIPSTVQVPLGYVGLYTINLSVYSRLGCSSTLPAKTIFVKGPHGQFSADNPTHLTCLGDSVFFTDVTNSINGVFVYWGGDGYSQIPYDTSNLGIYHFGHAFASCGHKIIAAYISDGSCVYPLNDTVNVDCPKANFTRIPINSNFCGKAVVQLSDSSLSSSPYIYGVHITNYQWSIMDSASSTIVQSFTTASPLITINTPGTYSVKLRIQTSLGCTDSVTQNFVIRIYKYPIAQFTNLPDTVCIGGCINFSNTSINPDSIAGNLRYQWYFDWTNNTMSSTQQSPQNCYNASGIFSTVLIDTSYHGCIDTSIAKNVVILPSIVPNFIVIDTVFCSNSLSITMTNTSIPAIGLTYCWNFGDSILNTCQSAAINPSHTFTLPPGLGSICYTIKLIAINSVGCKDSISKHICLYAHPNAGLKVLPTLGCTPLNIINATDTTTSQNAIVAWDLHWGDTSADYTFQPFGIGHTYTLPGTYVITYVVTTLQGCTDTARTTVVSYPNPVACAGNDTLVCSGQQVKLGCTSLDTLHNTFLWNQPLGGALLYQIAHPTVQATSIKTYYLTVISNAYNQCQTIDSIKVNIIPLVSPNVGDDSTICVGGSALLFAHGGIRYTWMDSSNAIISRDSVLTVTPGASSVYHVTVSGLCDSVTLPVGIQVMFPQSIVMQSELDGIVAGRPVKIPDVIPANSAVVSWYPNYNISCTTCPDPIFSPDVTTTYHVIVTNGYGCVDSQDITIHVLCDASNAVYVPNAFTPTTDGINSRFYVQGTGVKELVYLKIYDRWGGMVFNAEHIGINSPSLGWDGNFNGKPMSSDVFMYQLEVQCANGNTFPITGTVTLIR